MTREQKKEAADILRTWNEQNTNSLSYDVENALYTALKALEEPEEDRRVKDDLISRKDAIKLFEGIREVNPTIYKAIETALAGLRPYDAGIAKSIWSILSEIRSYEYECNITASETCKKCNKTCFDTIRNIINDNVGDLIEL